MNQPHLTEIGKIQKTHGVNGELQVSWSTDFYPEDHNFESVFLVIEGIPIPFFVQSIRMKGADSSIITLDEIGTIQQAEELVGLKVMAEVKSSGSSDELTLDDLVGFIVITNRGVQLGTIEVLQDYAGNLVFELQTASGNELLIPASPELIVEIDEDSKSIIMELPEGIADL
ncbi:MAG: ribosome maturation factor RimM [Bacteroidales bacterium]|jgi:16S rRNA processing protein RimM|nr:ribosome maturation factor RimM [Bacteroidales bacterium]MDY0253320.1 ribosome maturation factor RimM [Tenuifilaceae bacterium]